MAAEKTVRERDRLLAYDPQLDVASVSILPDYVYDPPVSGHIHAEGVYGES